MKVVKHLILACLILTAEIYSADLVGQIVLQVSNAKPISASSDYKLKTSYISKYKAVNVTTRGSFTTEVYYSRFGEMSEKIYDGNKLVRSADLNISVLGLIPFGLISILMIVIPTCARYVRGGSINVFKSYVEFSNVEKLWMVYGFLMFLGFMIASIRVNVL